MIVIGFNDDDCRSHHKFIYGYCLLFIDSIMIYLSIKPSQSIICIIFQWIKEYFSNLNDNLDEKNSENDWKCPLNGNMDCVTVAIICILMSIMNIICIIY